ncbi:Nucleotide-binding universal stress protein, UspA family [Georgenia satyanarayanai]|uniref:Nucleotide-binding universal stress protein, UspA family n=1 Tax=Georgenia satyanarayanai TaxID=860221 RepID=A0A2Y9AVA4_9MICO|nr:universal stress protein [Georgenia satyanarayanai]PYF97368.1 nucleotide-binding universal stress UspA family protein [Georgenia satyanarayanai]SSA46149.1 Nucleotide-binding universal stress protein, UspA family [Georgenia satyanarayanai]
MTRPTDPNRPVVVGVDGSALADTAVLWAAAEAERRGTSLHVVHAFVHLHAIGGYVAVFDAAEPVEIGGEVCERAARAAREAVPGLTVTTEVRVGRAAPELLKASLGASVLVLGARGHGRVTGMIVGSVSQQVAMYARCPVVVVRGTAEQGPVVVGVDGSPAAAGALRFAVEHAAATGASVRAVRAEYVEMPMGAPPGDWYTDLVDRSQQATEAARRAVEEVAADHPAVDVELRVLRRHPEATLVEESTDASLLVVAKRGLGGFTGLMLGSVSQGVLSRATVSVAVVPGGEEPEHPDDPHV